MTSPTPPTGLHVMTKPIGPICNLDCAYCYYLEKEDLYPKGERWRMPPDVLRAYIEQYIAAQPPHVPEIEFAWQGGEPTLLGIEFFQQVVELQQELCPPGQRCRNAVQTNGTLLDDDWCRFFQQHGFLIGLSVDGPAELHDPWRYDKQGKGSFDNVMCGWRLLKKHRVEHNILTVVNAINVEKPREVYRFLKQQGAKFIQFIPIVERLHRDSSEVSERTVGAERFGDFLCAVFDEWVRRDVGKIFVQIFDQALAAWVGAEPSLCIFRKECGKALALEHNGDLYSCDHFVFPEYKLGNIQQTPLAELAAGPEQQAFGRAKESTLPDYCRRCEVRFACNGECPKNRFIQTPDGEPGLNYLCAGYRKFFNHVDPVMQLMAAELRAGRPAAGVMSQLRQEASRSQKGGSPAPASSAVRRNDPCPCGSGRKYKQCCLRRR